MISSYTGQSSAKKIQEAFDMQGLCEEEVPLTPAILKVHFVSSVSGEGITSLRKQLYKFVCGALPMTSFRGFQILGQQVPSAYATVEHLVRQLRNRSRYSRREGEQRPFFTVAELHARLHHLLRERRVEERDFCAALNFLHEVSPSVCFPRSVCVFLCPLSHLSLQFGFVFLHTCCDSASTQLVSVDPQLVGFLLQRVVRAGVLTRDASEEGSPFLPVSHLLMLWGVDSIWSAERSQQDCFSSHHLLDFLHNCDMCTPLIPGLSLLPALLPPSLPSTSEPDTSAMVLRRVYLLSFLPRLFSSQLLTRVLSVLVDPARTATPTSPGGTMDSSVHAVPSRMPYCLPSGEQLYLWQQ